MDADRDPGGIMARLTCRCGEPLIVPPDGVDRIVCPICAAKVRIIRRKGPGPVPDPDGFLRFFCPCGRKLKVDASGGDKPSHGRCPDCGRVIATADARPRSLSQNDDGEAPTEDFTAADVALVEAWSRRHRDRPASAPPMAGPQPPSTAEGLPTLNPAKNEAGLRVCPQCGKPLHLGTSTCRACGIAVPRPS